MSVSRHISIISVLWLISSAVGIAVSLSIGMLPSPASHDAHVVDSAMTLMLVLAVPVFNAQKRGQNYPFEGGNLL